jgi:hypothetical protein
MARAAEMIACQPPEMHKPLVHHIAGFMSSQADMSGTAVDFAAELQQKVDACVQNPWALHTVEAREASAPKDWGTRVRTPVFGGPALQPELRV